ncbi:hypothetical protein Tco_0571787 [Tanacetum coccineum]
MAALPICDELRNSARSLDWESQFILRCRREIAEDLRLAREINALCARVTAIVDYNTSCFRKWISTKRQKTKPK